MEPDRLLTLIDDVELVLSRTDDEHEPPTTATSGW